MLKCYLRMQNNLNIMCISLFMHFVIMLHPHQRGQYIECKICCIVGKKDEKKPTLSTTTQAHTPEGVAVLCITQRSLA